MSTTLRESPSVGFRAKPSDESSGRNGPSRGLVPLEATTSKIETTRSRARPRKGALPFRAQHAPVALGADESGNLGVCIVSIPQYRSASTSRAVARSREVDAASSHTAPGDVVAPWPDPTTRALHGRRSSGTREIRAADRPHLVPLVDERSLYVSRRGCIQAYLCHSSAAAPGGGPVARARFALPIGPT